MWICQIWWIWWSWTGIPGESGLFCRQLFLHNLSTQRLRLVFIAGQTEQTLATDRLSWQHGWGTVAAMSEGGYWGDFSILNANVDFGICRLKGRVQRQGWRVLGKIQKEKMNRRRGKMQKRIGEDICYMLCFSYSPCRPHSLWRKKFCSYNCVQGNSFFGKCWSLCNGFSFGCL